MYCKCDGCGNELPAFANGMNWFKPNNWFERLPEGEKTPIQACSRKCIDQIEAARKNDGKSSTTCVIPM